MNTAATEASPDTDAVLETLADARRRTILRSLEGAAGNERSVEELVGAVLDGLEGTEPAERPSEQLILTELYHSHLPALEEMEMVVHDREADVVCGDADESTQELLALIQGYEST